LWEDQDTKEDPKNWQVPEVDFLSINTKNWYRKGTDLWAEFGKEASFSRKFSSKDSAKILACGSAPSFGRRAVCT
jgi:hypothetical protein